MARILEWLVVYEREDGKPETEIFRDYVEAENRYFELLRKGVRVHIERRVDR